MKNTYVFWVMVFAISIVLPVNAEITTSLISTLDSSNKYEFTADLSMEPLDVRQYGKKDSAVVSIDITKNDKYIDQDSNGTILYLDGVGWQEVNHTANWSRIDATDGVRYCALAQWTIDHPNEDLQTPLRSPITECLPRTTGGGGGDNCAIQTNCFDEPLDPLLVDLAHDGIHLGASGVGVSFDMNGDGHKTKMQWVAKGGNEAFLARDLNQNGVIDHGGELFGNGTILSLKAQASNGFEALTQFDLLQHGGNSDGVISDSDHIWHDLVLWLDTNADGISTPNEILHLADVGLTEIDVAPKHNNRRDSAGNWIPYWSWATNDKATGNRKHKVVDVFFKSLQEDDR